MILVRLRQFVTVNLMTGNTVHSNSLWLDVTLADGNAVEQCVCVCVCTPLFDGQEESETTELFIKLIGSGCC